MKRIALIDAYGFVFRAYHSLPSLTRKDGVAVGAVYGYTNMLIKLIASLNVSHLAVVFDSGGKTFRNEIYNQYKANRPECPEDLKPQFQIIRDATKALNLIGIEKKDYEADDIIASLAKKYSELDFEVVIVSSDKDLMQLVNEKVSLFDAMKNKFIKSAEVREKFMVDPNQVLDLLSLIGDNSDNIPGVKGIGIKTASELINKFGSIENIYQNLNQISQERRRVLLEQGADDAIISKKLAKLVDDLDLEFEIDDLKIQMIDPNKLISFLTIQGFQSLINKVRKEFNLTQSFNDQDLFSDNSLTKNSQQETKIQSQHDNYSHVTNKLIAITNSDINSLNKLYSNAKLNGLVVIDYLIIDKRIEYISLATYQENQELTEVYLLEIKNDSENNQNNFDLFNFNKNDNKDTNYDQFDLLLIKEILEDQSINKIFFKSKEFLSLILNYNYKQKDSINFDKIIYEDLSIINYLLNSSTVSKEPLYQLINDQFSDDLKQSQFHEIIHDIDKNKLPKQFDNKILKNQYCCFINHAIYRIYKSFSKKLITQKINFIYRNQELPLQKILAKMESSGILINLHKLNFLSLEFSKKIELLSEEIYQIAGEKFNIASNLQLSEILFKKLNLISKKKSKITGNLSTNIEVLEDLANNGFLIAEKIIDFRKFSKLKNTYTDGLPKEINSLTKRVHTHFSSISTHTGRLNSYNPNLQNIPIKNEEGKKIRECFIAKNGYFLLSADYSQIELRIIAHMAKIPSLIEAFKENKDIHSITASDIFKIPLAEVDDKMRNKAKAINFGIIYGISAYGLAKQLKIGNSEADQYIKSYFLTYPGIEEFMKQNIDFAEKNGYVTTLIGRKISINEINNSKNNIRNEAKRQAINAPIQGTSADIIKQAMINIDKEFILNNIDAKLLLQIHDELVFEVNKNHESIAHEIIKREMENCYLLDVPLKIEIYKNNF